MTPKSGWTITRKWQEIKINLKTLEDKKYKLSLSDNGTGIPKNLDIENTDTLGLQLVNALVEQIDGNIKLLDDTGTHYEIIFKEPEYKKRI